MPVLFEHPCRSVHTIKILFCLKPFKYIINMPEFKYCCNPFKKPSHWQFLKDLINITDATRGKYSHLILDSATKICRNCYKLLSRISPAQCENETTKLNSEPIADNMSISDEESRDDMSIVSQDSDISCSEIDTELLNVKVKEIVPIIKQVVHSQTISPVDKKRVLTEFKQELISVFDEAECKDSNEMTEIVENLKNGIADAINFEEKLKILTFAPKSWTIRKLMNVFGVSYSLAQKVYQINHGIGKISNRHSSGRKSLADTTVEVIKNFYRSDEISCIRPGKRDCIKVGTESVQKRHVLCNLREAYIEFKKSCPQIDVGFSTFARHRPRECRLAGSNGFHNVCVCKMHQNVKLLLDGLKAHSYLDESGHPLFPKHYSGVLKLMVCNEPTTDCYYAKFKDCRDADNIFLLLNEEFPVDRVQKSIEYMQWESNESHQVKLVHKTVDIDICIEHLYEQLMKLRPHDFVAKKQSAYLNKLKDELKEGCFLALCDFSENHNLLLQDAIQAYHWTKNQATLHPIVVYHREGSNLVHNSYVVISDCLEHDTTAIHLFLAKLVEHLKNKHSTINQIIYFSDGAGSRYKNKFNLTNVLYHEEDFGIPAEWHFFATSHGKSPCDGVGGSVKRLASRASLLRSANNQIQSPLQLFEWATDYFTNVKFFYATIDEHEEHKKFLETRFASARVFNGTRDYHSFVPVSHNAMNCKLFSAAEKGKIHKFFV